LPDYGKDFTLWASEPTLHITVMHSSPIHVSNLSCMRGGRSLFVPISFELAAGQTLILRGENGSGKSTLLRTLAGLIPSYLIPSSFTPHPSTLYLGHANALHPSMTVAEHLDFWRSLHPSRTITNQQVLETLGLAAYPAKLAAHLSNGQKRRLSFARLLLHPADLWLLDEPQAALDTNAQHMLHALLAQHSADGGMAIIASHDALTLAGAATLTLQATA
jgi:heme exporter protein A